MSKFSRFMRANKTEKKNGRYAPTSTLKDENGKPLEWEFRHITSKENEELKDACTMDVQVTGKPNLFRPRLEMTKYLSKLITASTVYPDLYDKAAGLLWGDDAGGIGVRHGGRCWGISKLFCLDAEVPGV